MIVFLADSFISRSFVMEPTRASIVLIEFECEPNRLNENEECSEFHNAANSLEQMPVQSAPHHRICDSRSLPCLIIAALISANETSAGDVWGMPDLSRSNICKVLLYFLCLKKSSISISVYMLSASSFFA